VQQDAAAYHFFLSFSLSLSSRLPHPGTSISSGFSLLLSDILNSHTNNSGYEDYLYFLQLFNDADSNSTIDSQLVTL
jgi:hypothetical protein